LKIKRRLNTSSNSPAIFRKGVTANHFGSGYSSKINANERILRCRTISLSSWGGLRTGGLFCCSEFMERENKTSSYIVHGSFA
jgi:hypothetical protein